MGDDLQEYYIELRKNLSVRANHILEFGGFEKATDVLSLLTDPKKILLLRNCGLKTVGEIHKMVCQLREYYNTSKRTNENKKEAIQSQKAIQELSLSEVQFIQRQYEQLLNCLSVRAQSIVKNHGLLQWTKFEPYLNSTEEDFLRYSNCGKKSAQELLTLASELQKIIDEVCCLRKSNASLNKTNENDVETIQIQKAIQELSLSEVQFIQRQYELSLICLSVRTYNIAKAHGFLQWKKFEPYLNSAEKDFLQFRNCGKKSAQELLALACELQKVVCESVSRVPYRINGGFPFVDTIPFDATEEGFLSFFHKKCNHWPMLFLSLKCSKYVFSEQELMVLNGEKTVMPKEVMTLSKTRLQQIIDKALEKIGDNFLLKELRNHPDWKYYDINNIPPFCDSLNMYSIFDRKVEMENGVLCDYLSEQQSTECIKNGNTQDVYCPINKTFLFQVFGLTCYFANLEKKRIYPYFSFPQNVHFSFYIDIKYTSFRYNKALSEVCRLMKVKTEENVLIPIVSYFIDNNYYWDDTFSPSDEDRRNMKVILVEIFQRICNAEIRNESLFIKANSMDYSNQLYEILQDAGERSNKDELLRQLKQRCQEKGITCSITDVVQLTTYLTKDPRIVSIAKSGFWGLKEWEEETGSIREISIQIVKKAKQPIKINDLTELVMKRRPDSNERSISSIIRQTASSGELLLFYDDFIGFPRKKYIGEYTLMPQTFDDWLLAFREFVIKNKRFPYSGRDGFEGCLYRWYYRASQLTELSSDEILKIDALGKELSNYPHNAAESNFLHNCNLYKKFVENNKRMITKGDDSDLFNWFYNTSRNFSTYNDNRNKYFGQLLEYLSDALC